MKKKNIKKKQVKKDSSSDMDSKVEKEIELERTHPEEIISDELALDNKENSEEPFNPELQKSSMKLVVITLLIVAGLLFSIFLITNFMADRFEVRSYTHNGFSFIKGEDDLWYTSFMIGNTLYPLPFHYGPRDLKDVIYSVDSTEFLSAGFIYLAMPPVENLEGTEGHRIAQAAIEVGKIVGTRNNIFNIPAKAVLSSESGVDTETPVVTCGNATSAITVVVFSIDEREAVYEASPNCYHVVGTSGRGVIKSATRLVYGLLGIM